MIRPTVGRVVLFHPSNSDETLAAIIACVWSDTCVNLAVFDRNGESMNRTSVLLIQDDNPVPTGGFYCEWMPYQKGQAAKEENDIAALHASLDSLRGLVEMQGQLLSTLTPKEDTQP